MNTQTIDSLQTSPPVIPQNTTGLTPKMFFQALRRWWVIPLQVVLVASAVTAVVMTFQPVYEASALLRINTDTPYIVFRTLADSKKFINNQIELIKSELVLGKLATDQKIVATLQKSDDPMVELAEHVTVRPVGESDLFRITFAANDPKDAAMVANEITKRYFDVRNEYDAERTQRVINLLDEEKRAREVGVKTLRENIRELAKRDGVQVNIPQTGPRGSIDNPDLKSKLKSPNLVNLQERVATSIAEQSVLKAKIQAYEEWDQKHEYKVGEALLNQSIEQHPQVQELQARIAQNKALIDDYERVGKGAPQTATYQKLSRQFEQDQKALEEVRNELRPKITQDLVAAERSGRERELANFKMQLENAEIAQKAYEEQLTSQIASLSQSTGDTLDIEFKMAELARANQVLDMIEGRALELKTERRAPERVEELQSAVAPKAPVERLPLKELGLAIMAGLMSPFALSLLIEYRTRRVNGAEQLRHSSQLAVIGEVPRLPYRAQFSSNRGSDRVSKELYLFQESVDILRTGLTLGAQETVNILAVTSACSREGKTSIAVQLAWSIAQATGKRTLLVDGDMRSPDAHHVFDLELQPGFAEVLSGEVSLEDAVQPTVNEHLFLLAAGKLEHSPHRLLGNGELADMLKNARNNYDYIVLDTPPVLSCGEAMVLAKAADATLLCAMQNTSRLNQVREVYDRLSSASANPVGVVLNGVPARHYKSAYGYYSYDRAPGN